MRYGVSFLTTISQAAIPSNVGRKPLDSASETINTTVRFTRRKRERIVKLVGEKGMAGFIREAVDRELTRRESADPLARESTTRDGGG